MMERVILHADLNNFYASVECLYHPEIRNRPVAVGGDPQKRHGIVLAKNDLAKQYGVKTGETLWQARQKCSDILFVPPHFDLYLKFSQLAKEIYAQYTDQIESFGLDECWLDITHSQKLFGEGEVVADAIRQQMKARLGITCSVGVSYNKIFAKLGSDYKKPDATTVISKANYQTLVWPLPIQALLYIGKKTEEKLQQMGIHTIGDLASVKVQYLEERLGKNGRMLWQFANGLDDSPVALSSQPRQMKSISNSTTCARDLIRNDEIKITMYALCESIAARLHQKQLFANTVQIGIKDYQFHSYQRQIQLDRPIATCQDIFQQAFQLLQKHHISGKPIRNISIRVSNLTKAPIEQLSLFQDYQQGRKQEQIDFTIDDIRQRFGHAAIQRGLMLKDPALAEFNPQEDHIIHPEGFFR